MVCWPGGDRGLACPRARGRGRGGTVPRRVRHGERIIQHIAVGIEALRVRRKLKHRVHRQEPTQARVIHPSVHMDQIHVIQHLLVSEPITVFLVVQLRLGLSDRLLPGAGFAPISPGAEA